MKTVQWRNYVVELVHGPMERHAVERGLDRLIMLDGPRAVREADLSPPPPPPDFELEPRDFQFGGIA